MAIRDIRNCNVAVIGGAGFLGSHLVNHLIDDRNCSVTVVDNLVVGRREFVHPAARFVHHDICGSEEFLRSLFMDTETKFVFNYCAWPYIPASFDRPAQVFAVNATGAIKVINAAHAAGCEGVLQVSSAEIYGNVTSGSIDENTPVAPHSTYGVSKVAVDGYVQVRWREAGVPSIALRQFNCAGERETHPYIVPEVISQIDRKGPTILLGNNSFRDFQYAGDAVRMAVQLLEYGEFGEVYNMGSETGLQIYDLARLIGKLMGHDEITIIQDQVRVRPWEIWSLLSDNTKLYSVIERPLRTPLEETLRCAITDYNDNGHKWAWE